MGIIKDVGGGGNEGVKNLPMTPEWTNIHQDELMSCTPEKGINELYSVHLKKNILRLISLKKE